MSSQDWYTIIEEKENKLKPLVERMMEGAIASEANNLPRIGPRLFWMTGARLVALFYF